VTWCRTRSCGGRTVRVPAAAGCLRDLPAPHDLQPPHVAFAMAAAQTVLPRSGSRCTSPEPRRLDPAVRDEVCVARDLGVAGPPRRSHATPSDVAVRHYRRVPWPVPGRMSEAQQVAVAPRDQPPRVRVLGSTDIS
jgi:hypothetical protein